MPKFPPTSDPKKFAAVVGFAWLFIVTAGRCMKAGSSEAELDAIEDQHNTIKREAEQVAKLLM